MPEAGAEGGSYNNRLVSVGEGDGITGELQSLIFCYCDKLLLAAHCVVERFQRLRVEGPRVKHDVSQAERCHRHVQVVKPLVDEAEFENTVLVKTEVVSDRLQGARSCSLAPAEEILKSELNKFK